MSGNAPIGVFDSGIGGLTVVKELLDIMPHEHIIYFGDTARTPYGSRPPAEILLFLEQILRYFTSQQVKLAVVACNTMTALGLESARVNYPFDLVGVNTGVEAALKNSPSKRIGVLATQATVASGKHGLAARQADPSVAIFPQACPKFVPLIEQEKLSGSEIEDAAKEYLQPLQEAQVDAVILGCTHYPYISNIISRIVGSNVKLIDPAAETANDAHQALINRGNLARSCPGELTLCFSADLDRAKRMANHLFDTSETKFKLVNLHEFS